MKKSCCAILLCLFFSSELLADGNATLGLSYDNTACGLNYVSVSHLITTRYNQYAISTIGIGFPAVYGVSGIPPCSNILKVYAYWGVSYQFGSSNSPTISVTNPNSQNSSFVATLIGQDGPKCWSE